MRKIDFLLFPVDTTTPRIVQVDCHIRRQDEKFGGEEDHDVDWHKIFGGIIPGFTSQPIGPSQRMSPGAPSSRLFLAFDERLPGDGPPLPVNLCAQHLTRGQSRLPWTGTLVGYRIREPTADFTQFLDVNMADLPQFVAALNSHRWPIPKDPPIRSMTPGEFLTTLARPAGRHRASYLQADFDFSSTAAEYIARERIVPPEFPARSCPRTEEEFGAQTEILKKVIQQEVRAAIWEIAITIAGVLVGAYALWRFVLSPSISFFLVVFMFFLRAPFILMKCFLWPLTLFKFALI